MRKVALHGSYFGYNFGDTLLCSLFCMWLHSAGNATVVLPLASRRNLNLIGADSRGLPKFLTCTDLIFCGGGYFGDSGSKDLRWTIRNFFRHFVIAELAMLLRKRVHILGTGVGPISSPLLRRRLKRLVEYADWVIVRDTESREFLRSLGVTREVSVDTDAAIYLEPEYFTPATEVPVVSTGTQKTPNKLGRPTVAVHLTNFGAHHWQEMADVMTEFLAQVPEIQPVIITDTVTRSGRPAAQDKAAQRLAQMIPDAVVAPYSKNPKDLCRVLANVDLVVTNKLHVGIVSVALGKHVISLPQHSKTPRFYKQIGLSSVCAVDSQPEQLRSLLADWHNNMLPRAYLTDRTNVYLEALHQIVNQPA